MILEADSNFKTNQHPVASVLRGVGVLGLIALLFSACGTPSPAVTDTVHLGETQGTTYMVKYHGADSIPQAAIDSVLEAVDVEFNLWRPASRINAINAFDRSDSLFQFVDGNGLWSSIWAQTLDLHAASQGAFDPTVQPLVELWGFGLSKRSEVTDEDVQALMPHVGLSFERIDLNEVAEAKQYRFTTVRKRDPQTRIDFNGIAQGMTVDLLAELLQSRGASDFMVEVGGEVRCGGKRSDGNPWRIAIDRPIESEDGLDQRELQAIVGITDAAICTSGNYRKFYEEDGVKRSHTISPFNGYPVQHGLLSATVHAVNASTADALATACMVWGPEEGQRFIETYREANPFERVEAYFISDGGTGEWETWQSAGWDDLVIR